MVCSHHLSAFESYFIVVRPFRFVFIFFLALCHTGCHDRHDLLALFFSDSNILLSNRLTLETSHQCIIRVINFLCDMYNVVVIVILQSGHGKVLLAMNCCTALQPSPSFHTFNLLDNLCNETIFIWGAFNNRHYIRNINLGDLSFVFEYFHFFWVHKIEIWPSFIEHTGSMTLG